MNYSFHFNYSKLLILKQSNFFRAPKKLKIGVFLVFSKIPTPIITYNTAKNRTFNFLAKNNLKFFMEVDDNYTDGNSAVSAKEENMSMSRLGNINILPAYSLRDSGGWRSHLRRASEGTFPGARFHGGIPCSREFAEEYTALRDGMLADATDRFERFKQEGGPPVIVTPLGDGMFESRPVTLEEFQVPADLDGLDQGLAFEAICGGNRNR